MRTIWLVCEACGHIEPTPEHDDRPFKCENCRQRLCCPFTNEEWALDHSEEVLERNEAYNRSRRGEMGASIYGD